MKCVEVLCYRELKNRHLWHWTRSCSWTYVLAEEHNTAEQYSKTGPSLMKQKKSGEYVRRFKSQQNSPSSEQ